ncbi:hypothetical protein AWQ21_15605 (plasmid) [Picosynechococcus sp. PCC 7003]|uniref:DUF3240 family protein n=1 Tax=Picosynechococcus sp. PCC 7003 TaxID=374981 RepID=UPI000810ED82|nr:DUF3240 family protein [Picosynechococcus sp. PCC 7003]ANV85947.1 hypothetical protein AWQ21_15605 [Picosynechococcus sp. PCC 7003]
MSTDFTKGMLVTIISEAVLQESFVRLLTELGVSGYTIIPAQGAGSHGKRMGDVAGYNTNILLQTIVNPELATRLLQNLKSLQETHALVAFQQPIEGIFD